MGDRSAIEWTDATWNPVAGRRFQAPEWAEIGSGEPGETTGVLLHHDRLDQPLRWRRPRRVFVNSLSDLFHDDVPDEFIARVFAVMALSPQHIFQVLTKRPGRMASLLRGAHFEATVNQSKVALWRQREATRLRRRDRLPAWLWAEEDVWPLPNVWLGVSVEDQRAAELRIPKLLDTPAAVRFLSCEPLLGDVDLDQWFHDSEHCGACGQPYREVWRADDHAWRAVVDPSGNGAGMRCMACFQAAAYKAGVNFAVSLHGLAPGIDWVIVGGESGPGARPMHPEWVRSLRDQCVAAGVPFFFKQWGEWQNGSRPGLADRVVCSDGRVLTGLEFNATGLTMPADVMCSATWMSRVGKKKAGRELDGRTWGQMPAGRSTGSEEEA